MIERINHRKAERFIPDKFAHQSNYRRDRSPSTSSAKRPRNNNVPANKVVNPYEEEWW